MAAECLAGIGAGSGTDRRGFIKRVAAVGAATLLPGVSWSAAGQAPAADRPTGAATHCDPSRSSRDRRVSEGSEAPQLGIPDAHQ
ncbi:MAG: twin-arginine translocation signal domain-containing protein [Acidobacteria bacterium]|nr:twin-arginine translocation signal domain-containing protein [Acidobacteriota bacterium]